MTNGRHIISQLQEAKPMAQSRGPGPHLHSSPSLRQQHSAPVHGKPVVSKWTPRRPGQPAINELCPPGMPAIPDDPSQIVPPPQSGGWGWSPTYGWGWFPMSHGSVPPTQPPIEPPVEPPSGVTPPLSEVSVLIFEDRFRAGSLNQTEWWTRYIYTGPDGPGTLDYLNDEWQRFRETGNHHFDSNGLKLTAQGTNGGFYPSGMVRSKKLFDLADGRNYYFECRAKMPKGKAIWTAFWLSADARQLGDVSTVFWPPEIDIMEIVNNGVEDTTTMLGCRCQVLDWDNNPQQYWINQYTENYNPDFTVWYAPFDFSDDFHTFALHYKRPNITFYCDGGLVAAGQYDWVWDDRSPAPPAHILCNLAIGGSWAGRHGVDDSAFPQSMDVDFIRVWCDSQADLTQNAIGKDYEMG